MSAKAPEFLTQLESDELPASGSETPTREGKRQPAQITPESKKKAKPGEANHKQQEIGQYYTPLVLQASTYLQHIDGTKPVLDTVKEPPTTVFWKDVAYGMFTLFYVNVFIGNREGNVYPILKAHQMVGMRNPPVPLTKLEQDFVDEAAFVAISPRRHNKFMDGPIYKNSSSELTNKLKEIVMVKTYAQPSTEEKCKTLGLIVQFLKNNGIDAEVKQNCDMTDKYNQALDHYIQDLDIYRILKHYWKGDVDQTFYDSFPNVREAFYSEPYPLIANRELGYPLAEDEVVDMTSSA